MPRICVTRKIPAPGPQLIEQSSFDCIANPDDRPWERHELLRHAQGADAILTQLHDRVDAELMDATGPSLRVVSNFAVGFNNVDVAEATRRGIVVCNTPGVLTEATADVAWLLLMGVARRVHEADRCIREGRFDGWGPNMLVGADITGRTLCIVGAGRIGYAVAKRARAWEMQIVYVARTRHEDFERDLGARRMELDAALPQADFVSIHTPLNPQTHHLLDARRLGLMKNTAFLINTARGPVVDEKALVLALQQGTIAGAGLDVYEEEPRLAQGLAQCPNTLLLPHLGSATTRTRAAMAELSVRNLLLVLQGLEPLHRVN